MAYVQNFFICVRSVHHSEHMATNLATECAKTVWPSIALIKRWYHRHACYKMELIYIQTHMESEGSLKAKTHMVQVYRIVFMDVLGLDR